MLGSRLHSVFPVCYTYARIQELRPLLKRFIVISTSCNQDNLLTEKSSVAVGVPESNIYVAQRPSIPLITKREIEFPNRYREPKQAWLESLDTLQDEKLGLVDLHPDIFGTYPRIDILHANIHWQRWYRKIDYAFVRNRAEMPGGGKKPRPQKKTGLKRQGSIRSPLWRGGGAAFGPRGPQSFYYMLPMSVRTLGLRVALSVKYAQNDLHIVNSLDIPSDDPKYIEDLIDTRFWGFSALFVDDIDIMPRNISLALKELSQFNLMPVYGLNVYSMLKHETLVLTLAAVEKLEKKLLVQMHKPESDVAYRKKH